MWKDILKVGLGIAVGSAVAYALYAYANKPKTEPAQENKQEEPVVAPEPEVKPVVKPAPVKKVRRTFGKRYTDPRVMQKNPYPHDDRLRAQARNRAREKMTDYKTVDILYRLCSPKCTSTLSTEDIRVIQKELAQRGVVIQFSFDRTRYFQPASQDGIVFDPNVAFKEPEPYFDPTAEITKSFPMPKGYVGRNRIYPTTIPVEEPPMPASIIPPHEPTYRSSSVDFSSCEPPKQTGVVFGAPQTTQTLTPLEQREQQMRFDRQQARARLNQTQTRTIPLSDIL